MIALLMINDANVLAARQTVKFQLRILRIRGSIWKRGVDRI